MLTRKLSSEGPKVNVRDVEKLKKLRAGSTPLRERLIEDLHFHHFSDGTIAQYLSELLHLAAHYWRSPAALTDDDLRSYFNYLQNDCGYSGSSMGMTHAALTFFYGYSCPMAMPFLRIFRRKRDKKLPVVLSHDEVRLGLLRVADVRYRTCLTLIYSCGLRISEAVRLEVTDIDAKQGLLHIRHGKGGKPRYVPLPDRTLQLLREMWEKHCHPRWLFPAYRINLRLPSKRYGMQNKPVSGGTIALHFKAALRASGCRKPATVHSLRHSYATHLLEEHVPLFTVKEYLGHSSIGSTMLYVHCTSKIRRSGIGSIEELMRDL
jgi:integrase